MDLNSPALQTGDGSLSSGGSGRVFSSDQASAERQSRARECDIRLTLPARAENIALVRHVIVALAESLALPPKTVEDIRLAVTEACTNVVRHAYRDRPDEGPLEIVVEPERDCLTVVVADRGRGIVPNPASEGPGLGLPLIAALADALEIEHSPQRGSRLSMQFRAADHEGAREAA
jgi:anti-sigma regulatory factor (Ser/Thr protein kinase)